MLAATGITLLMSQTHLPFLIDLFAGEFLCEPLIVCVFSDHCSCSHAN